MLQARRLKWEDGAEQGNWEKTELLRQDKQPEDKREVHWGNYQEDRLPGRSVAPPSSNLTELKLLKEAQHVVSKDAKAPLQSRCDNTRSTSAKVLHKCCVELHDSQTKCLLGPKIKPQLTPFKMHWTAGCVRARDPASWRYTSAVRPGGSSWLSHPCCTDGFYNMLLLQTLLNLELFHSNSRGNLYKI